MFYLAPPLLTVWSTTLSPTESSREIRLEMKPRMRPFMYNKLNKQAEEIRLVDLLPGDLDDPVRLQVHHFSLLLSKGRQRDDTPRISFAEVERSLPAAWSYYKNLEGRPFFGNRDTGEISWEHPDPKFDKSLLVVEGLKEHKDGFVEYEALSYVWGATGSSVQARIETPKKEATSGDDDATLDIAVNLSCALRHLRSNTHRRTLWIDAICINQADILERSEQVIRMHDIYRLASRVVVWLGPESTSSRLALTTLAHLGLQSEYAQDYGMWRAPKCEETDWWDPRCALPYDRKTWDSVLALLSQPWFERVWVVQEIQSSSDAVVQCGNDKIPWPLLRRAILTLEPKTAGLSPELQSRLGNIKHLARHRPNTKTFTLLCTSDRAFCSDPRDKIYGVLSMTSREFSRQIRSDYSMSCLDVYMNAVLAHINVTNRLEVLSLCGQCGRDATWPSWVPDYAQRRRYGEVFETYFAAGYSSAEAQYIHPDMLEVTGVLIDTVSSCSEEIPQDATDAWNLMRVWCKAGSNPSMDLRSAKNAKSFASAIRMGRFRDNYPNIYSYPPTQDVLRVLQKVWLSDGPISQQDAQILGLRYIAGGKVLSTFKGMPCNGPSGAQTGRFLW